MRRLLPVLMALVLTAHARADVAGAVNGYILPGFAQFAESARLLDDAARSDCLPANAIPAYQATFDAWMAVADLRIGPSETGALSVAFWPDDRGFAARALSGMISADDPVGRDPVAYADVSIAARGLFAMELLLFDPQFSGYGPGDFTCALVQTVAGDLALQATALEKAWSDGFATTLLTAGEPGNSIYLTGNEALQAIYSQLLSSLEVTADMRLGRPMGTFDRPRPRMAEAWRSGRSLRNVVLSVQANHDLAQVLAQGLLPDGLPRTDAAMARVLATADRISDPAFQDVEDPQARLRVEILQQAVRAMKDAVEAEIGDGLDITAGFNAKDGD